MEYIINFKNLELYSVCDGLSEKLHEKSYLELRFFRLPSSYWNFHFKAIVSQKKGNINHLPNYNLLPIVLNEKKYSTNNYNFKSH